MATGSPNRIVWIIFAIIAMALSGVFLYFAQKQIPVGTAYAVWTGIGAVCTFAIGVIYFNDALNMMSVIYNIRCYTFKIGSLIVTIWLHNNKIIYF